jgi:hypothetical protein
MLESCHRVEWLFFKVKRFMRAKEDERYQN